MINLTTGNKDRKHIQSIDMQMDKFKKSEQNQLG